MLTLSQPSHGSLTPDFCVRRSLHRRWGRWATGWTARTLLLAQIWNRRFAIQNRCNLVLKHRAECGIVTVIVLQTKPLSSSLALITAFTILYHLQDTLIYIVHTWCSISTRRLFRLKKWVYVEGSRYDCYAISLLGCWEGGFRRRFEVTHVYSVLKLYLELFPVSFLPRGRRRGEGSPLLSVSFSVRTKPTEPPRFTLTRLFKNKNVKIFQDRNASFIADRDTRKNMRSFANFSFYVIFNIKVPVYEIRVSKHCYYIAYLHAYFYIT